MTSSSPSRSVGNGTTLQGPPPSGNGSSRQIAQYTSEFSKDTSQPSYTVFRMLESVQWLRCPLAEAKQYKALNYDVYNDATNRLYRPPGGAGTAQEATPGAFLDQYEEVENAEYTLETAGIQATYNEGLMEDTVEGDADDAYGDIFDMSFESTKEQLSPKGKGKS